jgi:hypothetical protein
MAKRLSIPSKELQLHVVGPDGSFKASRVQRLTLNTDIPSTTVDELGNASHVGDVKDIPNITLTFSAFDVGINIFSALTGNDQDAYPGAGVDISELGEIDGIFYIKSHTSDDYVKCAHARKLQIRDFTFSYSVDGESTEDYTAVGSEKRWFTKDVVVDTFSTGTTSFELTQTPIQLKNGNYVLSAILDGEYLTEVDTADEAGEYQVSGTSLTTYDSRTDKLVVVYQADPAGENWADVSDTESATAIRGRDVDITIAANSIPRVQSLTINGTLNSEAVRELGNRDIVGYQSQVPEVTGTLTVLDTDTELLSLLIYGVTISGTEYVPGEGCSESGVALTVELVDPCDTTSPYTVLKTVYLDSITIVGDSYTANVNQNATQAFNFKSTTGHCVIYSGAKA